jgi:hypothetical protein
LHSCGLRYPVNRTLQKRIFLAIIILNRLEIVVMKKHELHWRITESVFDEIMNWWPVFQDQRSETNINRSIKAK